MKFFEASAPARVRSLPAGALEEASESGAGCASEVPLASDVVMIWGRRLSCTDSLRLLDTAR